MTEASRELLASRKDVWRFLAEPNHLTDWWPGVRGVEPDRRGFAAGARWRVTRRGRRGLLPRPDGGLNGRAHAETLVIDELVPKASWASR